MLKQLKRWLDEREIGKEEYEPWRAIIEELDRSLIEYRMVQLRYSLKLSHSQCSATTWSPQHRYSPTLALEFPGSSVRLQCRQDMFVVIYGGRFYNERRFPARASPEAVALITELLREPTRDIE